MFQAAPQRIVAFEPPQGWDRAATPPSARLLATWAHREGGRLTLAADRIATGVDAAHLFDESRAALENQGWTLDRVDRNPARPSGDSGSRVLVEASLARGRRHARQLYVVDSGFAYVVTMVASTGQEKNSARDFDAAVSSLRLGEGVKR